MLDVADGTERVPNADGSNNETHSNNEGLPSQRGGNILSSSSIWLLNIVFGVGTPSEGRLEATGLEVLDTSMELQVNATDAKALFLFRNNGALPLVNHIGGG